MYNCITKTEEWVKSISNVVLKYEYMVFGACYFGIIVTTLAVLVRYLHPS